MVRDLNSTGTMFSGSWGNAENHGFQTLHLGSSVMMQSACFRSSTWIAKCMTIKLKEPERSVSLALNDLSDHRVWFVARTIVENASGQKSTHHARQKFLSH